MPRHPKEIVGAAENGVYLGQFSLQVSGRWIELPYLDERV